MPRNGHFWQVGLWDIVLSEYPEKSHNFRNFIFMTSHFSTLFCRIYINASPSDCHNLICTFKQNFFEKNCFNDYLYTAQTLRFGVRYWVPDSNFNALHSLSFTVIYVKNIFIQSLLRVSLWQFAILNRGFQ